MKQLRIPYITGIHHGSLPGQLVEALAPLAPIALAEVSWLAYSYRPTVSFKIAYTQDSILLRYDVKEQHIKAEYRNTNDPVYNDSCVEFFLSFDGTNYYNLEFNCMGTGLIAYGDANKEERKKLANDVVEQVKTNSTIHSQGGIGVDKHWSLLLDIPFTVFQENAITALNGMRCTGNFYKCGDGLPIPHYVSWNRIDHPAPNFHLPQFFGELRFE